jgi:hypothetical protein
MSNLRDELQTIYEQHGVLTPRLVLEEARAPEHPLHSRFEWDDTLAAESWRLEQAHHLIMRVRIVYIEGTHKNGPQRIRAFHSMPDGAGYKPAAEIAADEFLSELVLQEMERSWFALKRKYGHFAEFIKLIRQALDESAA